ncbi:OmpA/MotB family protein [Acidaminobacterium chupaoyuni]
MRKRPSEEGGGDSWLNTYADMVTLLLTFFAVLLSMSSVNKDKFNAFIESFSSLPSEVIEEIVKAGNAADGEPMTPEETASAMEQLFSQLDHFVKTSGAPDAVNLSMVDDVIYVRFDSAVFFEPDRYAVRPESTPMLAMIGNGLKKFEKDIQLITVCGHTATTQRRNSDVSDWMLSGERAAVVAIYLEEQQGFDPKKLIVMGYGNNFPVAENETEEGRRANRRVELAIIGNNKSITLGTGAVAGDLQYKSYDKASTKDVLTPPHASITPEAAPQQGAGAAVSPQQGTGAAVSPYNDPE